MMKIITTAKNKTNIMLFGILFSVFSILCAGTIYVSTLRTLDVSIDNFNYKTVIIDAGHGGVDGGTSAADGTLEKDINLQIALKLDKMLNAMGVKTILIRDSDISIHNESAKTIRQKKISDLNNRLNIIHNTDDPIFVSIHQNHFGESKYKGTQVFYSKNNPLSSNLAEKIRMPVISYLQKDNTREIKQSGSDIFLLYHSQAPSVMVECGFLSNPEETENLKNENYQQKLSFLIAIGIMDYFNNTEEL